MAEEKIKLTLGGTYTAGQAFGQWNSDIKKTQQAHKDLTQAARSSLSQIAGVFEGELNGSITKTSNLLGDLARGGVWGVLAAVANFTVGFIVEKIQEMREAAVKFAETLRNEVVQSITSISENFKKTSDQINQTKADAKDMMDVLNGEIAKNSQLKIHELHIETLQKITDDMSKAGKDVILADEAYQVACIKGAAAVEAAANATQAAKDGLQATSDKRVAAEEALANITEERKNLEALMADNGRGWLAKRQQIQDNMAKNEQMYADGLIDQSRYLKFRKDLSVQLSKLEEEHKDELTQLNNVKKSEAEASKIVEMEKRNEASAQKAVTLAMQKEEIARLQAAQAEMDAEQKLKEAEAALAAETESTAKAQHAADEKAYMDAQAAYITQVCAKRQVKAAEYIELFTLMTQNGATETEAYAELQKKLNEEVEKRAKAEDGLTKELKTQATQLKGKKGDKESGSKSTAIAHVSIDPKEVGEGVQKWDGQTTWSKLRDKMSDDVKNEHQEQKRMRAEMLPFTQLLKGNMTQTMAKDYVDALGQSYSKEQLQKMFEGALKSQLLSNSEQRQQFQTFKNILKCLEDQGLK